MQALAATRIDDVVHARLLQRAGELSWETAVAACIGTDLAAKLLADIATPAALFDLLATDRAAAGTLLREMVDVLTATVGRARDRADVTQALARGIAAEYAALMRSDVPVAVHVGFAALFAVLYDAFAMTPGEVEACEQLAVSPFDTRARFIEAARVHHHDYGTVGYALELAAHYGAHSVVDALRGVCATTHTSLAIANMHRRTARAIAHAAWYNNAGDAQAQQHAMQHVVTELPNEAADALVKHIARYMQWSGAGDAASALQQHHARLTAQSPL